jgi:hypothetical protein
MSKDTLKKEDVRIRIGFVWLRMGSSGGVMNTVVNLQVPYKAVTLTS